MGLFKSVKDMKALVSAGHSTGQTNGPLHTANRISTTGRVMQLVPVGGHEHEPSDRHAPAPRGLFQPIAGVDLTTFAQISSGLAKFGYDQTEAFGLAASQGVDSVSWQAALDGWNQRIATYPAVARRFNALYTWRG